MIYYQKALKTFIDEKLSENTFGVLFDVNLYNDIVGDDFNEESNVDNTYKTEFKRKVPAMITNIQGEYIPIPNLNGTNNSVEIIFDLAIDDMTGTEREEEFSYVDYNDTLSAIDEFKNTLLANYYPLGNSNIMLGGEDSKINIDAGVGMEMKTTVLTFTPTTNDEETIFTNGSTTLGKLYKTSSHIKFYNETTNILSVPYTVNEEVTITIYRSTYNWNMSNGTDISTDISTQQILYGDVNIGYSTGLQAKIKSLTMTSELLASELTPEIDISDFDNKDVITNDGDLTVAIEALNCILFGEDGNVVFQVYPLAVVGDYKAKNGINYHSFSLQLEAMIGDNFIFGNNFEYYIDDEQVYPVDRNHTFALDVQGRQGINENVMTFVGSESSLDWTQSFFYQPSTLMTSLVKKITTGVVAQNTVYTIKVQYPFWNKEYEVIIEGGGINTDINSITTFTLQFKLADDIIIP